MASTPTPSFSSLVITPHRDLAYQMLHWIESLIVNFHPRVNLQDTAQVLARDSSSFDSQLDQIRHHSPRILIGTPQALLDMHGKDQSILKAANISTIALDEADYLLGVPSSKIRTKHQQKATDNFERHPSPTRILLDELLPRKPSTSPVLDPETVSENTTSSLTSDKTPYKFPQMIVSSATLHYNLKVFLSGETGWFLDSNGEVSFEWVKGNNNGGICELSSFGGGKTQQDVVKQVTHHALVVSRTGNVSNLPSMTSAVTRISVKDKSEKENIRQEEIINKLSGVEYVSCTQFFFRLPFFCIIDVWL